MDKGYKEVTHIKSTNDKHTKDSETQMIENASHNDKILFQ